MSGRRIEFSARDGLRLAATEWPGAAGRTALFCLSGISRTALDYAAIGARQGGTRRVVALDYAGHGDSERAADPARYRPEALIADVIDAMAALHLHRVALIGTSFGGLCAMAVAAMRPAALEAVVLNDIGPVIEPGGRDRVIDFIGTDPGCATLADATAWLRQHHPPMGLLDAEGWQALAARTYAQAPDGRFRPRWDTRIAQASVGAEAGAPPDLWPYFRALAQRPLMLVWGQESHLLSADTVALMRAERPDLHLVSLPGTGHAPTLDEPAAAAAIDAFLARLP